MLPCYPQAAGPRHEKVMPEIFRLSECILTTDKASVGLVPAHHSCQLFTPPPSGSAAHRYSSLQDFDSFTGYPRFLDNEGYPASKPPWGTLNYLDLNTGKLLWTVPLGENPDAEAMVKSSADTHQVDPRSP
jgi:hypothetical protein